MPAVDLVREFRARRLAPVEVLDAVLAQFERVNPRINAIITPTVDAARQQARAVEQAVMRGEETGPLAGVPLTIKDLHQLAGVRTTFGSKLFENFVSSEDSILVTRLKRAGCVILGKTNTSEFGLVPLAINSIFGDSNNPWLAERNTGGSSGGSAAAVACGIGPIATGSDGGGSIRIPASFCGVFGVKPHLGRVPHVPFPRGWESLAHHGPLSRTVRDAARMLDVMRGPHEADRWSLPATSESYEKACDEPVKGLRVAWSADLGGLPIEPEVADICQRAALRFEEHGVHIEPVELPTIDLTRAQQVIVLCEAATGLESRRSEWEQVIHPSMRRMFANADELTYQDLVRANWAREECWTQLHELFETYDALLTPTAPIHATLNGTLGPKEIAGQRVRSLSWLSHCVPFNMTWQPAASLPVGFDTQGVPVGLQIVSRRFDEPTLFRLAAAYEAAWPWTVQRPPAAIEYA